MAVTALSLLKGYFTCDDEAVKNKYYNLLESFFHKSEGNLVTGTAVVGDALVFSFSDGSTQGVPLLPDTVPVSFVEGLQDFLNNKVDKVQGKGLSTEDFTNTLKQKLEELQNYVHPDFHQIGEITGLPEALDSKVDKVAGKELSSNDFTTGEKETLATVEPHVQSEDIHVTAAQKKTYANKLKTYVSGEVLDDLVGDIFRIYGNKIYSLNAALPYTTNDIEAEADAGDWAVELAAPEAGLTFKDADGIDKFTGSFALFEGFGFDPATKKIISIPLSAFKVFIDSDNGDDSSAQINDPFKPFKTDAQAMAALPVDGNVWDFELIGTSSHILTAPYMSRHIRIISKTKSMIDLSAYNNINFSATPFYLDAPFSTVIQSGGTGYTQTTVQDLFLRCASYVSTNENHCFATSKINSLISIGEVTTKGHAFHGGSIIIGQYNCENGMLLRSQSNEKNVNLKIKEVITNGTVNVGFIGGATMAKRPYEIVTNTTGSNFISTSSIRDFNLTGLRCNAGCVLTTSTISVISGVVSSYFLGSIKPSAGAKFKNFAGRLLPVSGGDSYAITYDISDSTIYLDGFLCAGLAQFEHPDRVFKFSNVLFIQDNPQDLIQNFNAQTLIEVQKSGFIKSNGTLGDAAPNVTVIDKSPNNL